MLRHALLLALDAQSLVDRAQLEQKSRLLEVDRSNDTIEVKGFLTRGNEDQVLIGKPALLADRLMQQPRQGARVNKKGGKSLIEHRLTAGCKERFRSRVEIFHVQRAV